MSQLDQFKQVFSLLGGPLHVMSKSKRGVIGGKIPSPEALVRWVGAASRPEDFYVCLNPSVTNRIKPSIEDITEFRWWMVDLDPLDNAYYNLHTAWDIVHGELLAMFGTRLSYVQVSSGRGGQFWIPMEVNGVSTATAQRLVKGCTAHLVAAVGNQLRALGIRIDEACAEISHLARLPGTTNTKTGNAAYVLHDYLPTTNVGPQYMAPSHMLKWIADAPPEVKHATYHFPLMPWEAMFLWNGMTPYNRAYCQSGVDSSVESRHNRACAVAKQLKDLGVPKDTAESWLRTGANMCKPHLEHSYIDRLLRETYGREGSEANATESVPSV